MAKLHAKQKPKSKVKAKAKVKVKTKVKAAIKSRMAGKAKPKIKSMQAVKLKATRKPISKTKGKSVTLKMKPAKVMKSVAKARPKSEPKKKTAVGIPATMIAVMPVKPMPTVVKRTLTPLVDRHKPIKRSLRVNQYTFMKAPGIEHAFEVGDSVEVFCDHEKSRERVRGWIKGIVVQVDNKMVAVQFRSNVYLTDGWMVPDRILWYPLTSEHIREVPGKKPVAKKEFIPEY